MILLPDFIFRVVPRNLSRDELRGKMAFTVSLFLGIILSFISYQVGISILIQNAVVYGTEKCQFVYSHVANTSIGQELARKSLDATGYQPFFTYMNISVAEIILPCLLKSFYVTKRLHQLVCQRWVYAIYFALVAGYSSFAREFRSTRDAALLIVNGLLVLRTFDLERYRPVETVTTIALTCACVVPLHLVLDFIFVMCLSEQVVRAYQGDTKKLKVLAGCVTIDCLFVQFRKLISLGDDIASETLQIAVNVSVSAVLLNVALACGRPKDLKNYLPAFITLFYIYIRSSRTL